MPRDPMQRRDSQTGDGVAVSRRAYPLLCAQPYGAYRGLPCAMSTIRWSLVTFAMTAAQETVAQ